MRPSLHRHFRDRAGRSDRYSGKSAGAPKPPSPWGSHHRASGSAVSAASGAALGSLFLPLMIHLQSRFGFSPVTTGAITLAMVALSCLTARLAGKPSDTRSPRVTAALGCALLIAGTGSLAGLLHPGVALEVLVAPLLVSGLGIGLVSAPLAGLVAQPLQSAVAGAAPGVAKIARQAGGTVDGSGTVFLFQDRIGGAVTAATQATLALPVVALLVGLGCCAVLRSALPQVE
ncbi:MFS transporter [Streptomyces sp. NPDC127178]|uniref:MFS transporter n=1 Tax=unclassified Streptomyces TaxID=2593676 RepID=UPI00363C525A